MPPKLPRLLFFSLLLGCFTISSDLPAKKAEPVYAGLTVHEWGTFTSIAGTEGQAVEWSPLTGSTDLPGFVEHSKAHRVSERRLFRANRAGPLPEVILPDFRARGN